MSISAVDRTPLDVSNVAARAVVKPIGKILIVDHDPAVRDSLAQWFSSEGYRVRPVPGGHEALQAIQEDDWEIALIDIALPGTDGMESHGRLLQADPELTVIVMAAYASVDLAVHALQRGVYDYIAKPVDPDALSHLVRNAFEHRRARREVVRLRENLREIFPSTGLIGKSAAIKRVFEAIGTAAPAGGTVLILGEIGAGKEVVARAIHSAGPRQYLPMLTVHCGSLTGTALESELFGKKGKFEIAGGGAVFLDEVGDMSLEIQARLLRVLQEKEIVRIGGNQRIKVECRCIAATSKNLEALVRAGTFLPDLYYRLHAFCIDLPPLRERKEDIPLLASHFVNEFCMVTNRPVPQVSAGAMDLLMDHDWPGNVRELKNAIERALATGRGGEVKPAHFNCQFQLMEGAPGRTLDDVERAHIERILLETNHNMSKSARILDIDRTTLYNKVRRYK